MGWIDPQGNPFSTVTVPGSSLLMVSNGVKTAGLPITPVVVPV